MFRGVLPLALVLICVFPPSHAARGDRLTLKDGTVLDGTVIPQGEGYWFKGSDGHSRIVAESEVMSVDRSGPASPSTARMAAGMPPAPAMPGSMTVSRIRADAVESTLSAVAIWQEFVDHNPASPDLPAAKLELAKWKALADAGAEKIGSKWVGGDDLKDIKQRAQALTDESVRLLESHQTLKALPKLQESARIYPNSPRVNYLLGWVSMQQQKYDDAAQYFQTNVKYRPDSAEALANLGVALAFKKQWERSIQTLQKACEARDSKEIAQDLVDALSLCPPSLRNSASYRSAADAARLLADEYRITASTTTFVILPPPVAAQNNRDVPASEDLWSGTGFVISPDGMILTNRHVVKESKTLLVLTSEGQVSADVVAIDDVQDLALIRIRTDGKAAFIRLAAADVPAAGAECTVLGYPLIDRLGADLKVTRGIVSSSRKVEARQADVMVDAKVNPGNSGGPMLDQFGNVIAIVCMKSLSSATEESYGIGISSGHIRAFLEKYKVKVTPADAGVQAQSTEEAVRRARPAIVCILATK